MGSGAKGTGKGSLMPREGGGTPALHPHRRARLPGLVPIHVPILDPFVIPARDKGERAPALPCLSCLVFYCVGLGYHWHGDHS